MGRGLGRPLRRLGLTAEISGEDAGASFWGDVGDSVRQEEEIREVLLVVGEASSVWRRASFTF